MLEIELKFPVADFTAMQERLSQWQARVEEPVQEADHYFNAPDRDFGKTDEAFRLRRVGSDNRITYKGPKHAGPTKTRTEYEVGLESGDAAAETFCKVVQALGYRPVAVVRKRRVCYHLDRDGFALCVTCDDVEHVGQFTEVEIVAPESDRSRAQDVLQRVAKELGLTQSEPRAYLQMLLEIQGRP